MPAYHLAQLAFDLRMLFAHARELRCLSLGPGTAVLGLVVILEYRSTGLLLRLLQTLRPQRTAGALLGGETEFPTMFTLVVRPAPCRLTTRAGQLFAVRIQGKCFRA